MKNIIAFHSNQLSMTGTEVALYDYAVNNEAIINNKSVVLYDKNSKNNCIDAVEKFRNRFDVFGYESKHEIDNLISGCGANLFYMLKPGKNDGLLSNVVPTMVHAVFPTNPSQMHGASYAFVSEWLSRNCSNFKIPCVPHIVDLPAEQSNLREKLGIPASAKVLGCYGGSLSFDVRCAISAVHNLLSTSTNTYFIFMNIEKFVDHPQAIFLTGSADLFYKVKFINSCDVMLHARRQGESFGLACGEFSLKNKPIITYAYCKHTHHLDVLGDKGFYYKNEGQLIKIINSININYLKKYNWDRYSSRYNAEAVMALFDEHLVHAALANKNSKTPKINISLQDRFSFVKLKSRMLFYSLPIFNM
jgi:hypothetical protein